MTSGQARWPREPWLDALAQTEQLSAPERAAALAYWSLAGSSPTVRVRMQELQPRCGLSRGGTQKAVSYLVETGWLTATEEPSRGRPTEYELTYGQDRRAERATQRVATLGGNSLPAPSAQRVPEVATPGGNSPPVVAHGGGNSSPDVAYEGGTAATLVSNIAKAPSSKTGTPPPTAEDELWMVVIKNLPRTLADSLTRTRAADDVLRRLKAEGCTAEHLASQVSKRGWTGCQAGGVITWLRGLDAMPAAPRRRPPPVMCTERGHEHQPVGSAGCGACRFESLGVSA